MLPDFGSLKRRFNEKNNRNLAEAARGSGLPGFIEANSILQEGHETVVYTRDGMVLPTPMEECRCTVDIEIARLEKEGIRYVDELQGHLVREMNRQMSSRIIERIGSISEQTGNTFDAGGRPLSPQLLIEMLEKYPLDFDEKGEPRFPTFFVGEKLMQSVKRMCEEQRADAYEEQFKELIERKRQEWRAREATRRLVE